MAPTRISINKIKRIVDTAIAFAPRVKAPNILATHAALCALAHRCRNQDIYGRATFSRHSNAQKCAAGSLSSLFASTTLSLRQVQKGIAFNPRSWNSFCLKGKVKVNFVFAFL